MSQHVETEAELVSRAQGALSQCNWVIGECAAKWTRRYARGRTDADFGELIGLSGDQVYQRRRVWETFADVYVGYEQLKWSHFYIALNWDDAPDCLRWANDNEASVAEMRAWRRAQHGEDLSQRADEPPFDLADPTQEFLSVGTGIVRDPHDLSATGPRREGAYGPYDAGDRSPTALAAARESGQDDYAPFGKGARGPAREASEEKAPPSSEQVIKRICSSLERCDASLTPEILQDFREVPYDLQTRLLDAIRNLVAKTRGLKS